MPLILRFEVFCASAALRRRTAPEAGAGKQGRARSPARQAARRILRPWPHGAPCLPLGARCTVLTSAHAKSFGAGRWKLHSNCVAAASPPATFAALAGVRVMSVSKIPKMEARRRHSLIWNPLFAAGGLMRRGGCATACKCGDTWMLANAGAQRSRRGCWCHEC